MIEITQIPTTVKIPITAFPKGVKCKVALLTNKKGYSGQTAWSTDVTVDEGVKYSNYIEIKITGLSGASLGCQIYDLVVYNAEDTNVFYYSEGIRWTNGDSIMSNIHSGHRTVDKHQTVKYYR